MRIRKTAPKEFTVDRSKWVHGGEGNRSVLGYTSLLNKSGNMCCLGFYAMTCGATKDSIRGEAVPGTEVPLMYDVTQDSSGATLSYADSTLLTHAMLTNDNPSLDRKQREASIKQLFKSKGVKLKFIGRYPKGVV